MNADKLGFKPSRLFGRGKEIRLIREVYQRVASSDRSGESAPQPEAILVSGHAGCGKTSLIKDVLQKSVENDGGFFVSGKYDQNGEKEPLAAIGGALSELFDQLERKGDKELNRSIRECLEANAAVVNINMMPRLAKLLPEYENKDKDKESQSTTEENHVLHPPEQIHEEDGEHPVSVRQLEWGFHRTKKLFLIIITAITRKYTVVLFLDDLQWTNSPVLESIQFCFDKQMLANGFLFIGSYRSNELAENPRAADFVHRLESNSAATRIKLNDLTIEQTNELLSDLLRVDVESASSLAQVVQRKTSGNAFFILQFIEVLQKRELMTYSFLKSAWKWDVNKIIAETSLSDNVVDIVSNKIRSLPEEVSLSLQVAACLGNVFDASIAQAIVAQWQTKKDLESSWRVPKDNEAYELVKRPWDIAMEELLIDPSGTSATQFKFAHDRIQQAAYSLVPSGRKRLLLHLHIGKFLCELHEDPTKREEWMQFVAVDQLNRGANLITSAEDRCKLAAQNHEIAEKAASKSAFFPAADNLRVGINLLGDRKWEDHYDLTIRMESRLATYEYCCGEFELCRTRIADILVHASSLDDKMEAYFTLIECLGVQRKTDEVLDLGYKVLKQLGVNMIPKAKKVHVLPELICVKKMMRGKTDEDLINIPKMEDPKSIWAVRLLTYLATFASFAELENELALIVLNLLRLMLVKGQTKYTSSTLLAYAILVGGMFQLKDCYRLSLLALRVFDQYGDEARNLKACVLTFNYSFIHHLRNPVQELLNPFIEAHKIGLETGDLDYAMIAASTYCLCLPICELPLPVLEKDARAFAKDMRGYKQEMTLPHCLLAWQFALNLMGKSKNVLRLEGDAIKDLDAFLTEAKRQKQGHKDRRIHLRFQMQLAYHMCDWEEARAMALKGERLKDCDFPNFLSPVAIFWRGMVWYALHRQTSHSPNSFLHLRRARKILRTMKCFVDAGMVNCHHLLQLLLAEDAATRVSQKIKKHKVHNEHDNQELESVRSKYMNAIQLASRTGFLQTNALANERVALFCHSFQMPEELASFHMQRALTLYQEFGAVAKVRQIRDVYGHVLHNGGGDDDKDDVDSGNGFNPTSLLGRQRYDPKIVARHHEIDVFHTSFVSTQNQSEQSSNN